MQPTIMQLIGTAVILVVMIIVVIYYEIKKGEKAAAKNSRELAYKDIEGLIEEINSPSRYRWVNTPQGEVIQFIYLLLGSSEGVHLVWAEVTLFRTGAEVKVFHTGHISPFDTYVAESVSALREKGWTVNVYRTEEQPNLEHTGIHTSEVL